MGSFFFFLKSWNSFSYAGGGGHTISLLGYRENLTSLCASVFATSKPLSTGLLKSRCCLKPSPTESSHQQAFHGLVPTLPLQLGFLPPPPRPYSVFFLPSTYYLNISCSLVSQCHCNDYSCCLGCPCFTGKLLQVLPDPLCFDISLNASLTLGSTWKLVPIGLLPQLLTPPALSGLPPAQLLDGWISEAFPDAALFPLHSLRAGCTSKLRLHLDHAGSNHVAFPT